MKELMIAVSGLFGKRYTDKQKERFILYMRNRAKESGLKFTLDTDRISGHTCRNIYLGNVKRANLLLTIPYDTSTGILWPNSQYYPINAQKNIVQNSIAKGLNFLLAIILIVSCYFFIFQYSATTGGSSGILPMIGMLLVVLLDTKIIFGWANRNNYSRNSASIVVALECFKRLQPDSVAVALLDDSCCGFGGYQQLSNYLIQKGWKKRIIALDCVANGQELHLHGLHGIPKIEDVQDHQICSENQKQSVLELFPDSLILTGGQQVNGETVIFNTRNGKDCQIDLDKMERVVNIICKLANECV